MMTLFDVLAEPTRRQILDLLRDRSRPVGELVDALGITQPSVSKHLRVLREHGLVRVRSDAQRRWYELQAEPLAEILTWIAPYRPLLAVADGAGEGAADNSGKGKSKRKKAKKQKKRKDR